MAESGQAGDFAAINRYGEGDALNTLVLYLRWAYFSTRMTATGHNATVQNLLDYLEREQEKRPHLGEFADRWQASERPCPLFVPEPQGETRAATGRGALAQRGGGAILALSNKTESPANFE